VSQIKNQLNHKLNFFEFSKKFIKSQKILSDEIISGFFSKFSKISHQKIFIF